VEDEGSQQPGSDVRDRILQFIRENPGCHLRKIKDELDLAMGTVQYHLDKLEKAGRITSQKQGLHKYYFVVGAFEENEKQLLEVLSNETAREILMFIIEQKKYPSQIEISKHIGISSASVSWHIKRLQDYRIIDAIKEGKFKRYKLHGDSKQFVGLLRNYYPSIWNRWSNRLAEIFLSLSQGEEQS
jgi:predicted transcriptional regulator